ncbi:EAL domain, c-di-GMP-specific phosphodiesterase class I (or its enzymatically inactive variant) [Limimonas halophila]|uniref:EAL domain, c-di-GMP-specific phosphodiesterase class I (Or its enzymatically inactive variant) n=1 Tax=Limimonas halophila TaxID=1082479 RepID=A0A1G7S8X4_9PROT|nr:EAL domain-containing protein [Limimonas halophila]SDG19394.1 EAL domain, c-di-GMP-specific phosphodiesterase class I (or its enzymatically inactive variant) [Limimonas halophila]
MTSDAARLLDWAREAVSTATPRWVEVLDLSQLPHADETGFQRALVDILREHVAGTMEESFRLPGHRLVVVSSPGAGQRLDATVSALGERLAEAHLGAITAQHYRLPQDSRAFLAFCREAADADHTAAPGSETDTAGRRLARLAEATRMLSRADISPFLHESPIVAVREATARVHAHELVPNLAEIERTIDVPITDDPWLTRHLEPILDGRILMHVLREPHGGVRRLNLDLTPETVESSAYQRFRAATEMREAESITFEIPYRTVIERPEAARTALDTVHHDRFRLALDRVPPDAAQTALESAGLCDMLKVDVRGERMLDDTVQQQVTEAVRAAGKLAVVADGVSTEAELAAARACGVPYVQGGAARQVS